MMGEYVNSRQARFDKSYVSCGLMEVHHLPEGDRQTAYSIANALYHKANPRPAAFILFSDVIKKEPSRGLLLAAFLGNHKLGDIVYTPATVNPKTGNVICVWVFTPDHERFRAWYTEETMHRVSEE